LFINLFVVTFCLSSSFAQSGVTISGELKQFHRVTLTFDGPESAEDADPNPFLDYRLIVYFTNGKKCCAVPGFYTADANAAESSAQKGNKWRVRFTPDSPGTWTYIVSFRTASQIAINSDPGAGQALPPDGTTGTFDVAPTDKQPPDFRAKGFLLHQNERCLRFTGTGEYFLKAGADCPENFLAYVDFDGTFDAGDVTREGHKPGVSSIHKYLPHERDWNTDDPTWRGGKGKSIIGALNYLASKRVNSLYFITYNVDGGDGKDVWPWTAPDQKLRFDCSKLDQWEIVFSHMDSLGIALHLLTQETENDQGLDGGDLGIQRKLYYRELIARFAHHPALVWNLGEENTNTAEQLRSFAACFKTNDPYKHPIVVHTFPGQYDKVYNPLLANPGFDGASLQMNETGSDTHAETLKWVRRSAQTGRKWFVCLDEFGHGRNGVKTDDLDPNHEEARTNCLWPNLLAGGAGVEWYFGYKFPHNDLTCEDFRSRDRMWDLTRYAVDFFHEHLPFAEMSPDDSLVSNGYCLAKPGCVYAIYLPQGGTCSLNVTAGSYSVRWFNPRSAGPLQTGSISQIQGHKNAPLGDPPEDPQKDWVILIKAKQ